MAWRYLRRAHGRQEGSRFLRFIIYVAIGGVAVGVATLLLALSVVRGFSSEIEGKIVGFGAHVQVENYQDAPLDGAAAMAATLDTLGGVKEVASVVQEFALLRRSATEIEGVSIWGTVQPPTFLASHLLRGSFDFAPDSARRPGIVLGEPLARLLDVEVGDLVTAYSMRSIGRGGASAMPRIKQFHVTGVYETALAEFDELYVVTDIDAARDLFSYTADQVTRYDLLLNDPLQARHVADEVEATFGFPVIARTVFEVFRGLFAWVNLQEQIIPLVLGVIVLVGAFNIVGTLLMMMLEKNREMGILESMGASARALRRMFLWLGLLIGLVGTAIGEALALVLALLQDRYQLIPLPAEAYYMNTAPIELNPFDFVVVAAVALVLCMVAAYVPARVAARIEPIKAIRFR